MVFFIRFATVIVFYTTVVYSLFQHTNAYLDIHTCLHSTNVLLMNNWDFLYSVFMKKHTKKSTEQPLQSGVLRPRNRCCDRLSCVSVGRGVNDSPYFLNFASGNGIIFYPYSIKSYVVGFHWNRDCAVVLSAKQA